jgi:uncharacterized protein (TIGR02246 family)
MSPHTPEDWPRLFTQSLNSGELEAVMELYEPDSRFVALSGETVGRDQVRDVLAGMIQAKTRLQSRLVKVATVGDIALLCTDYEGSPASVSARPSEARYRAIEVLRRQPDGTWKLLVGNPRGRES